MFLGVLLLLLFLTNSAIKGLDKIQGYSYSLTSMIHIGGIPFLEEGKKTNMGSKEKELEINKTHTLPYDRIKNIQYVAEHELVDKQKSVIKRAIAGGLLGPVGAIVGAVSGVGTKKVREPQYYLTLEFLDKENKEKTAVFLVEKLDWDVAPKFVKDLREKVGINDEPKPSFVNKYEI